MSTNGSESTYTDRKKVGHFTIPYTHINWTGLSRIGPQPRKSTGNLGDDFSEFESYSKTHRLWWRVRNP